MLRHIAKSSVAACNALQIVRESAAVVNSSQRFLSENIACCSKSPRFNFYSTTATNTSQDSEPPEKVVDTSEKNPEQEAAADNAETVLLLKQRTELEEKVADLNDRYKRALAETENVRRRMTRQIGDAKLFAIQGFCKDLLDVADVLELAIDATPQAELSKSDVSPLLKSMFEGIQMTRSQLLKVFEKNQLQQIEPLGEKFDPNMHEAMFEVPDPEKQPGTVAVVVKRGYMLHERAIRPAKVGVVKSN